MSLSSRRVRTKDVGERGHRGEKGDPGPAAKEPVICGWKIDAKNFRAVPSGADGKPLPELDLYPLAQAIIDLAVNAASDEAAGRVVSRVFRTF
jgi:hypothetical protein